MRSWFFTLTFVKKREIITLIFIKKWGIICLIKIYFVILHP